VIPLDEARAFVLGACGPLPTVRVALSEALGCVAVDGLVATESVPPFANTAVDGFAVRAADTTGASTAAPVRFDVIGTIRAGMAPAFPPGRARPCAS
jgi:molybdopterin molybdotransferase